MVCLKLNKGFLYVVSSEAFKDATVQCFEEIQKKTSKVPPFEVAKIPKEFLAPTGFF